ncbi:MAG TPA: helix-turn-helix transcriptional regulator [Actinomycetales bacterium]|nr:helix-turn-helix transcriptional regulator [Actinomycetales bacterium]
MSLHRWPKGTYMKVVAGQALKRRRQALGYSLRDVAILMGRPNVYTFLGRLEREDVTTCSPEFAASYAAVLQRDIDELFMPRVPNAGVQTRSTVKGAA